MNHKNKAQWTTSKVGRNIIVEYNKKNVMAKQVIGICILYRIFSLVVDPITGFTFAISLPSFVILFGIMMRNFLLFVELKGLAGGTASGKATVCNMIISQLHDQRVVLVSQVLSWISSGC